MEQEQAFTAAETRDLEKLQAVVPQIVDPNATVPDWCKNGIDIPKASLLHVACFSGSFYCVRHLITCGADVNQRDDLSVSLCFIELLSTLRQCRGTIALRTCCWRREPIRIFRIKMAFVFILLDCSSPRRSVESCENHHCVM